MKRLFVAIKIIPEEKLLKAYSDLRRRCYADKIKWVGSDLFHLTLKFIGETEEDKIPVISDVLHNVAKNTESFSFDLQGLGIFGSSYRPRIIHANIRGDNQLTLLGSTVLSELDKSGFPNDRQNFVPHLTLGRIKFIQNKKKFQQTINLFKGVYLQKVRVDKLILFESILYPPGPVYTILEKYKLSGTV